MFPVINIFTVVSYPLFDPSFSSQPQFYDTFCFGRENEWSFFFLLWIFITFIWDRAVGKWHGILLCPHILYFPKLNYHLSLALAVLLALSWGEATRQRFAGHSNMAVLRPASPEPNMKSLSAFLFICYSEIVRLTRSCQFPVQKMNE